MKHSQLDHTVQALKEKSLPTTPAIEAEVLYAIRATDRGKQPGLGLDWLETLLAPRFATACLALALICSVAVTSLSSTARQDRKGYSQSAAKALGFDTFQATDLLALSTPSKW